MYSQLHPYTSALRVIIVAELMQKVTIKGLDNWPPHLAKQSNFELQNQVLQFLAEATGSLEDGVDYEKIVCSLAELLVRDFATWCTIDLLQDDGQVARVGAAHRESEMLEAVREMQNRYPPSPKAQRGVYRVISTRNSILIPHVSNSQWADRAESPDHLELILKLGSSSYMCVPLIARNEVVGAVMLLSRDRIFDNNDLAIAEQFAKWIAVVVDNIGMFRKMKSALIALEATQNQLVQSSKMAALGVISAGIAHEINNPLAVIRLSCEKIVSSIKDSTVTPYFEKLQDGVDRIAGIVSGITDFSRFSGPVLSPVDLNSVIEHSLSLVEVQLHGIEVDCEFVCHHKGVIINGSSARLEQVMVNVLSNAIFACREAKPRGKVTIDVWKSESYAKIKIRDNGCGVDSRLKDRVFEPFFTTKGAKGSGLGLSISHGIIKDHGGEIVFDSEIGKGTQVTIDLPLLLP